MRSIIRILASALGARVVPAQKPGDTAVIPLAITLATTLAPTIVGLVERAIGRGNGSTKKTLATDAITQIIAAIGRNTGQQLDPAAINLDTISDIIERAVGAMKEQPSAIQPALRPTLPTTIEITDSWVNLVNYCIGNLSKNVRTVEIDREDMRAIIAANGNPTP